MMNPMQQRPMGSSGPRPMMPGRGYGGMAPMGGFNPGGPVNMSLNPNAGPMNEQGGGGMMAPMNDQRQLYR